MLEQKHGIIIDGKLVVVSREYPNSKPIRYADTPEYNQEREAVLELPPIDKKDHIFVGLEVKEVPQDERNEEML